MIENLRYYIIGSPDGGKKLRVCWNWVGVSELVKAHCRVVKRLNGDVVYEKRDITVSAYRQEKSGWMFDMPQVPVLVEVSDDEGHSWTQCVVTEAPAYQIKAVCKSREEEAGGFFRKKKQYYARFISEFSGQIGDQERVSVPGWIVRGVSNGHQFFFSKLGRTQEIEVTEKEYTALKNVTFEIVPEVEKTKYHCMFTLDQGEQDESAVHETNENAEEVRFEQIKHAERENGFYPVRCPYCFQVFKHDEAVFRSEVYQESVGYPSENDEKYIAFCNDKGKIPPAKMGHVLTSDQIKRVCYAESPDQWIEYGKATDRDDIIVRVEDDKGNRTHQKLCPHCHSNIPVLSGMYPMVNIVMMGDTGTGKTVYLAAMLHQMETGALLPGYRFACTLCDNERSREIKAIYDELIAGQKRLKVDLIQPESTAGMMGGQSADPFGTPAGGDPFGASASDPFGTPAGGDPFGAPASDPFGTPSGDDPFGNSASDPFGAPMGGDPFAAGQNDPFGTSGQDPFSSEISQSQSQPVSDGSDLSGSLDGVDMSFFTETDSFAETDERAKEEELPQASLRKQTERKYIDPAIYELEGTDPFSRQKVGVILSFFDFPGEAIRKNANDVMTSHDKYLDQMVGESDGMIFLFDPSTLMRVSGMEEQVRNELLKKTMGAEAEKPETVSRHDPATVLGEFRDRYVGGARTKLGKPVAFVVSKADAIRDYLRKADQSLRKTDTFFLDEGVYALDGTRTKVYTGAMRDASAAIEDFMDDSALREASRNLMQDEQDAVWVCVSATGIAPDENGTLYQRHGVPVHVMEPVEWILLRISEK